MLLIKQIAVKLIPFLSYDQDREIWVNINLSQISAGESLLDAGAGECRFAKYATHLKYISQDFAQYTGEGNNKGLQTGKWDNSKLDIVSDITEIPLQDASINNILCSEVLEHIPHPEKAIKEFSRLIKPGGKLLLTAPFTSLTHYAPYHFCTGFNKYWYENILTKEGFEIETLQIKGNYFTLLSQETLRLPLIVHKYSTTRLGNIFAYILFLFMIPSAFFIHIISKTTQGSEELTGIGIWITAKKKLL